MKKTFEVIKTVLTWLIVLLAVCMMVFTIVSVTTFDRNDRALFGYKMYIVRSDSMSATDFKAGDLILVRSVDPTTLQPGDIIAFTSQDSANFGETVTHKIRSLTTDADGQPAFITYGTTTDTDVSLCAGQVREVPVRRGQFLPVPENHPRLHSVHLPAILFADPHGGHQLRPAVQAL